MEKFKEVLKVILSFILGTALSYIIKLFTGIEQLVFVLCIIIIVILFSIIIFQKYKENRMVRNAVIIFLMNDNDELLLVHNHTHKILLPPCKTMKAYEMHHQAVERVIKNQVGLTKEQYKIDERFHRKTKNLFRVLDFPAPYAAQQEFSTRQSKRIRFHYSFIYVYKLKPNVEIDETIDFFPRFFSLAQIEQIEEKLRPFQDIIMRYREMINDINQNSANP